MTDRKPLMPKATAVWLVDNTGLSFDQIAQLCGLHVLEVKGIADDDVVAKGIKGMDPIASGQLTREEIARAEADPSHRLRLAEPKVNVPQVQPRKKGPRYTPVSRRHDRPNAVLWLMKNHPELKDSQIMRLVGTTKPTIQQIRERSHWNSPNLVAQDPVTLGLCSQTDLDAEVHKSAKRVVPREGAEADAQMGGSLLPVDDTTTVPGLGPQPELPGAAARRESEEAAQMFARLQQLSSSKQPDLDEAEPFADAETVFARRVAPAAPGYDDQPDAAFPDQPVTGDEEADAVADTAGTPDAIGEDPYGIGQYVPAIDDGAVAAIVRFCGIALRSADGSLVSCSSTDELDRVRESFLKRKLKLTEDDEALDAAIADVCEQMQATRRKHRVVFYYLLAERFGKLEELAG